MIRDWIGMPGFKTHICYLQNKSFCAQHYKLEAEESTESNFSHCNGNEMISEVKEKN